MSVIIFDLSSTRDRFERIVEALIKTKGLQFSVIDTTKIDNAYNELIQSMTNHIVNDLKNKQYNSSNLDSIPAAAENDSVDRFNYFLFSEYSIDIPFESLSELVSNIETALIDDITTALPNVDDKSISIIGHYFVPLNSLAIEYKEITDESKIIAIERFIEKSVEEYQPQATFGSADRNFLTSMQLRYS